MFEPIGHFAKFGFVKFPDFPDFQNRIKSGCCPGFGRVATTLKLFLGYPFNNFWKKVPLSIHV